MKKLIQKTRSNQQKDVYCRCYIYIHALLVHERITMPTQTALRVRGGKAGSLQLAEKSEICSMLQLNSMHNSLLHKA